MMNKQRVCVLACLFTFLFCSLSYTEEEKKKETYQEPQPYTDEEFPEWLKDLRRAEIIFFGSLPFTLLISLEGYEVTRYLIHGTDPIYCPWPFKNPNSPPYKLEEQLAVIGGALVISGIIALTDYLIGKATHRNEAETRQP